MGSWVCLLYKDHQYSRLFNNGIYFYHFHALPPVFENIDRVDFSTKPFKVYVGEKEYLSESYLSLYHSFVWIVK